jgi:uncharacterized membrane protein YqjE
VTTRFVTLTVLAWSLSCTWLLAQSTKQEFWFTTGRPLANAADQLEKRYGWIVTYEDVPSVWSRCPE